MKRQYSSTPVILLNVGRQLEILLLTQVTSSQGLRQASRPAGWQKIEGANGQQFNTNKSKGCHASDKSLVVEVQSYLSVFTMATLILKSKQYKGDQHDSCAKVTREYVKSFKFPEVSSHNAQSSGHSPNIQGCSLTLCLLVQVASSQGQLQASGAAAQQ